MWKFVHLVILIVIIFPSSVPIRISFIPYRQFAAGEYNKTYGFTPANGIVKATSDVVKLGWMLKCEADFPIEWNITGYIESPQLVQIRPFKRMWNRSEESPTFTIVMEAVQSDMEPFGFKFDYSTSASVSCKSIENPLLQETVLVFLSDDTSKPFVRSNISVFNSKIIPCATRAPDYPVKLYEVLASNAKVEVQHSSPYHPVFGFSFNHLVEGKYVCVTNATRKLYSGGRITETSITSITASIMHIKNISQANPEYQIEPRTYRVDTFRNTWTTLTCRSPDVNKPVSITIDEGNSYDHDYAPVPENLETNRSSGILNSTFEANIQLYCADCFTNIYLSCRDTNNQQVWRWWITYKALHLSLDNYNREITCYAATPGYGHLSAISCTNPSQCEWMKQCFNSDPDFVNCNSRLGKLELSKGDYYCGHPRTIENDDWSYRCSSLKFSTLHGIAQCRAGKLSKEIIFYTTLDNLKKNVLESVQPRELIQMDPVSNVQYTNVTSYFFCRAVSFFFFENLAFQMELKNGSVILLEVTPKKGEIQTRRIHDGILIAEFNITLPLDAIAMRCLAGWWNSSEFVIAEHRFKTLHQMAPQMLMTEVNQTIILSTKNTRLNCFASAEPPASYSWTKDDQALVSGEKYKITVGEQGESLFLFEDLHPNLTGEYFCTASNQFGSQQAIFLVKDVIIEEGINKDSGYGINMVYIFVSIMVLLVALLGIFCLLHRIHAKQKILSRKLTEGEIKDFKEGNPSLLPREPNSQHVSLLPFKSEHEIDSNDLQFDSSKLLGYGTYGMVVLGTWKSKGNKPVAVKISKPTADMNIFNALLLEVKIMSYLEKHENIITFYGACISDIENRNIYIVLELCLNGSIEKILKRSNSKFVNLMDDNQEINTDLLPSSPQTLSEEFSTLDLIRWSAEIARGMEYLSYKGIVHADLATRNILLTEDGIVKISDFGLSRQLYAEANYVKKTKCPLPWRWMALESLKQSTFSSQSDVWSYGITVWEIFTLGDTPFANETWNTEFVRRISQGMRPGKPKYANSQIYIRLIDCWDINPNLRPQFSTLANYFEEMFNKHKRKLHDAQYTLLEEENCDALEVYTDNEASLANDEEPNSLYDSAKEEKNKCNNDIKYSNIRETAVEDAVRDANVKSSTDGDPREEYKNITQD